MKQMLKNILKQYYQFQSYENCKNSWDRYLVSTHNSNVVQNRFTVILLSILSLVILFIVGFLPLLIMIVILLVSSFIVWLISKLIHFGEPEE